MDELLKDYDVTIQYHPDKANNVADLLSQKTVSMDNLTCLGVPKQSLAREIQTLELPLMQLDICKRDMVLAVLRLDPLS